MPDLMMPDYDDDGDDDDDVVLIIKKTQPTPPPDPFPINGLARVEFERAKFTPDSSRPNHF